MCDHDPNLDRTKDTTWVATPQPADSPVLLTVEEAAQLLRIGRTKTYGLLMAGVLRSVTIGRRRLVPYSSLEQFVANLADKDPRERPCRGPGACSC